LPTPSPSLSCVSLALLGKASALLLTPSPSLSSFSLIIFLLILCKITIAAPISLTCTYSTYSDAETHKAPANLVITFLVDQEKETAYMQYSPDSKLDDEHGEWGIYEHGAYGAMEIDFGTANYKSGTNVVKKPTETTMDIATDMGV